jgi:geranylgeranyl diphosphate synthase type II
MLIHLLRCATPAERLRLGEFLALPRPERTAADVGWVRELMDDYDCLEYARRVAHGLAGAARHECEAIYGALPASRDRAFIEELPTWVLERA